MKKEINILLFISFLGGSSFSQSFSYYFNNDEINKYLHKNPIEFAFNEIECIDVEDISFPCVGIFGKLEILNVNDSTRVFKYENGNLATEIIDLKSSKKIKDFYFGTSLVFSESEYNKNMLINITFYTKKGKKLDIGNFKNGSGELKCYRQNETLSAILSYKNCKLDGKVKLYYSNGKIMLEGSYKEGKEVGDWKESMPIK